MFANKIVPNYHWRFRTYYFDAYPFKDRNNPTPRQKERWEERDELFNKIEGLERFSVRRGYCRKRDKKGYPVDTARHGNSLIKVKTIEQKMVDVQLSTEMTRIAWSQEARHIGLVGGDADFVAAVEAAKNAGAIVRLFCVQTETTKPSDKLMRAVDERVDLEPIFEKILEEITSD